MIDIHPRYIANIMNQSIDEYVNFQTKLIFVAIAMADVEFAIIDVEQLISEETPETEFDAMLHMDDEE
tara:strand:- start:237 stop:440 length:204 start_codon:yes stop_codon:yes gene_type:complete